MLWEEECIKQYNMYTLETLVIYSLEFVHHSNNKWWSMKNWVNNYYHDVGGVHI